MRALPHAGSTGTRTSSVPAAPNLAAWFERARARPSVAATFEAANTAIATSFDLIPQLVASGNFKREYRDHRLDWMMRSGGAEIVLEGMRQGNIRFTHDL